MPTLITRAVELCTKLLGQLLRLLVWLNCSILWGLFNFAVSLYLASLILPNQYADPTGRLLMIAFILGGSLAIGFVNRDTLIDPNLGIALSLLAHLISSFIMAVIVIAVFWGLFYLLIPGISAFFISHLGLLLLAATVVELIPSFSRFGWKRTFDFLLSL